MAFTEFNVLDLPWTIIRAEKPKLGAVNLEEKLKSNNLCPDLATGGRVLK